MKFRLPFQSFFLLLRSFYLSCGARSSSADTSATRKLEMPRKLTAHVRDNHFFLRFLSTWLILCWSSAVILQTTAFVTATQKKCSGEASQRQSEPLPYSLSSPTILPCPNSPSADSATIRLVWNRLVSLGLRRKRCLGRESACPEPKKSDNKQDPDNRLQKKKFEEFFIWKYKIEIGSAQYPLSWQ